MMYHAHNCLYKYLYMCIYIDNAYIHTLLHIYPTCSRTSVSKARGS